MEEIQEDLILPLSLKTSGYTVGDLVNFARTLEIEFKKKNEDLCMQME